MIDLPFPLRAASPDDAAAMAELVNMAGEGLPLYLWTQMAEPGETPWDVGRKRALREQGSFSYRNTVLREEDDGIAGCMISYSTSDEPDLAVYEDMPAMFVPLQQLEDLACGTWYVNVLAVYPQYRGRGFGAAFLTLAEQFARHRGRRGLSVIVSDANAGARRLYERHGYREHATRKMAKQGWQNAGNHWVLLLKDL